MRVLLALMTMSAASLLATHAVGDDDMARIFSKQGCRWYSKANRDRFTDAHHRSVSIYQSGGNWPRVPLFPFLSATDKLFNGNYCAYLVFESETQLNQFVEPPTPNQKEILEREGITRKANLLTRVDGQQPQVLVAHVGSSNQVLAIYLNQAAWANLFSGHNLAIRFPKGRDVEFSMSGAEGDAMRKVIADFAVTAK